MDDFTTADGQRLTELIAELTSKLADNPTIGAAEIQEWKNKFQSAIAPNSDILPLIADARIAEKMKDITYNSEYIAVQNHFQASNYERVGFVFRAILHLEKHVQLCDEMPLTKTDEEGKKWRMDAWNHLAEKLQAILEANPPTRPPTEGDEPQEAPRFYTGFYLQCLYVVLHECIRRICCRLYSSDFLIIKALNDAGKEERFPPILDDAGKAFVKLVSEYLGWETDEEIEEIPRRLCLDPKSLDLRGFERESQIFLQPSTGAIDPKWTMIPGVDELYDLIKSKVADQAELTELVGKIQSCFCEYLDKEYPHFRGNWLKIQGYVNDIASMNKKNEELVYRHAVISCYACIYSLMRDIWQYWNLTTFSQKSIGDYLKHYYTERPDVRTELHLTDANDFVNQMSSVNAALHGYMRSVYGEDPFEERTATPDPRAVEGEKQSEGLFDILVHNTYMPYDNKEAFAEYVVLMDKLTAAAKESENPEKFVIGDTIQALDTLTLVDDAPDA